MASTASTPPKPAPPCELDVELRPHYGLSLALGEVPPWLHIRLRWLKQPVPKELSLVVHLGGNAVAQFPVENVSAGVFVEQDPPLGPPLVELLGRCLQESVQTFEIAVFSGDKPLPAQGDDPYVARWRGELRVHPPTRFLGESAPPEALTPFVCPLQPLVSQLAQSFSTRLEAAKQAGGPADASAASPALDAILRSLHATLAELPWAAVDEGPFDISKNSDLALPVQMVEYQSATPVELAMIGCGLLLRGGYRPVLVIGRRHIWVGHWTHDDGFAEGWVDEAPRLRNRVALGDIRLLLVTDMLTEHGPGQSYAQARLATDELGIGDDELVGALDVGVTNKHWKPLPPPQADGAFVYEGSGPRTQRVFKTVDLGDPEPLVSKPLTDSPLRRRLRSWQESLLDLSLRNRLLAARWQGAASISLGPLPLEELAKTLVRKKRLRLLAEGASDDDARVQGLQAGRLLTGLGDTQLLKKARYVDRQGRRSLQEGGAHTLFLSVGVLRWYESPAHKDFREAPLLLVPVDLLIERGKGRVSLSRTEDDVRGNASLAEKLSRDFDLDLDALAEVDCALEELDVASVLGAVRRAIATQGRWEVLDHAHIGIFTFTKFLMWRDLEDNADTLLKNPVVRRLALGNSQLAPLPLPPAQEPEALDEQIPSRDMPCVLDADSSQMAAIVSVLKGRSFVLQGPPGTGKSQTITNLIAAALSKGKSVLFVAEKQAALDVVKRRLSLVGLGHACLEIHSHKASKRQVIASLEASLAAAKDMPKVDFATPSNRVDELRRSLNEYVTALHRRWPNGQTYYEMLLAQRPLEPAPSIPLPVNRPTAIDRDALYQVREAVIRFSSRAAEVEPLSQHAFLGVPQARYSATRATALRQRLQHHSAYAQAALRRAAELCQFLSLAPVRNLAAAAELASFVHGALQAGAVSPLLFDPARLQSVRSRATQFAQLDGARRAAMADLSTRWNASIFSENAQSLERQFAEWTNSAVSFVFLNKARRGLRHHARGRLPDDAQTLRDLRTIVQDAKGAAFYQQELAFLVQSLAPRIHSQASGEQILGDLQTQSQVLGAFERLCSASPENEAAARAFAQRGAAPSLRGQLEQTQRALVEQLRQYGDNESAIRAELGASEGLLWPAASDPTHLEPCLARIERFVAEFEQFRPWVLYGESAQALGAVGLDALSQAHRQEQLLASQLVAAFDKAYGQAWLAEAWDLTPALAAFDGPTRNGDIARFAQWDGAQPKLAQERIGSEFIGKIPQADGSLSSASELGIIVRETRKKSRHLPLRSLFAKTRHVMRLIKPVFLMSPLSVSQYLPADAEPFDLVIFDEASQLGTHDAIGALARGKQALIVGDSKQLPPTAFFKRGGSDDEDEPLDENDIVELESVLEEALACQIPAQTLGWHYRSRHEGLISFSNAHYYENRLQVFPTAHFGDEKLGLVSIPVEKGIFYGGSSKGHARTNPEEAQKLLDYLVPQLLKSSPEERSFGVVTFNMAQQELISEMLDEAREKYPQLEAHFQHDEGVFVKNLENVQGDERDEILFSTTYARDERGKLRMHFGPLSNSGGERRLNVAITRARQKLVVVTSLSPADIDLRRTSSIGASHLRAFLHHARGGEGNSLMAKDVPEHPLSSELAEALAQHGFLCRHGVGVGSFRVELAVSHPDAPERYLLGINWDGPNYAKAATARDRDRLRAGVLKGMGWQMVSLWAPEYCSQPAAQVTRIITLAKAAHQQAQADAKRKAEAAEMAEAAAPSSPSQPSEAAPPTGEAESGSAPTSARTKTESAPVDPGQAPATTVSAVAPVAPAGASAASPEHPSSAGPAHTPSEPTRPSEAIPPAEANPEGPRAAPTQLSPVVAARTAPEPTADPSEAVAPGDDYFQKLPFREPEPASGKRPELGTDVLALAADWRALLHSQQALYVPSALKQMAELWGVGRLTSKAKRQLRGGLEHLVQQGQASVENPAGDFAWAGAEAPLDLRQFFGSSERKFKEISSLERQAALGFCLERNLSLPQKALFRQAIKELGIKRWSASYEKPLVGDLAALVARAPVVVKEEQVRWVGHD